MMRCVRIHGSCMEDKQASRRRTRTRDAIEISDGEEANLQRKRCFRILDIDIDIDIDESCFLVTFPIASSKLTWADP